MNSREIIRANLDHAAPLRPGLDFDNGRMSDMCSVGVDLPGGSVRKRWVEGQYEYYDDMWGNIWVRMSAGKFNEEPVRRAVWEHKLTHLPYGIVDYLELFFALKTGEFTGDVSSEEYFQDGGNQYEQLRDGIKFLKECYKHAPSRPEEPFLTLNK